MNAVEHLLGAAALARHGARTALICGDESVTYGELAARTARSAAALGTLGVRPGERVLLMMRDTPEFAAAWLGTVHAGAVAVGVNSKLSNDDARHIAIDSGAKLALIEDAFVAERGRLAADVRLVGSDEWRALVRGAPQAAAFDGTPDTPALMLYSSGTTGRPKGIVHRHHSILCVGASYRELDLGEGDCVFTTSKFFFAYGLEHGLLSPLSRGATSLLYPDWPDAEAVVGIVSRHRPAAVFSVPTIYRRLLAEAHGRLAAFSAVRHFVAGGERLSSRLELQWKKAVGAEILNLYGMSETFCACILTPPGTSDGMRTGKPLPGVEVRLLAAGGAEPAAEDPGVLWVRHPAQASGYANLPEQTREQFRDGWFCSRDLFVRDADGYYIHQGRSDELIKVAGQWVQPGELEETAAREAAVAEAACVPVLDADGLERLALFVTARGDAAGAQRAALEACERTLPRHKRPKWVRAVEELPRTATGKVQRYKLREILERELAGKD
ncbi:MAG TPA: AMP-binding protein [Burkholderiales bacterium]|nr:AMP-binding protein [Burkholderiales bacterium]